MSLGFKTLLLITIFYIVLNPNILTQSQQQIQQVPCLFLFGDSIFDNGNNNKLVTLAKANYKPYGIDFPAGPTGRFSNGENQPDFLAQFLGFSQPIPPFVNTSKSDILKGVNYASGGGGIRDESGNDVGGHISFNEQLKNHKTIVSRITTALGGPAHANSYLNKCMYVLNIGTNDYLENYLLPGVSPTRPRFTPQQYATVLIQQFSGQLETLYNDGARKIAIFSLGPLGCIPLELKLFPNHGSPCVDFINNYITLFNNQLRPLVDNLNTNLKGSHFIYVNVYDISLGAPAVGINITTTSCCPTRPSGLCTPYKIPCANRDQHTSYDGIHPTEALNRLIATRAYNASVPSDAYPYDIRRLALQL